MFVIIFQTQLEILLIEAPPTFITQLLQSILIPLRFLHQLLILLPILLLLLQKIRNIEQDHQ